MALEDWMGIPVVITVIILGRSKVRAIVEARERHRQSLKEQVYEGYKGVDEGMSWMDRLKQNTPDYARKQKELKKLVENLTDKVQKLETQPVSGKSLVTSSTQNLSNSFDNLTTSFQVKADLDLGKFSGIEPVPSNELTFNKCCCVRKKDGSLRFCIDLHKSNARTIKDAYSLPRIDEMLDCLGCSVIFTSLDLKSDYWQVEMDKMSKQLKTFTVGPLGFYKCERMPFGLTNAPATFQRLMESCLGDLHLNWCIIYLDDIIVFSVMPKEHIERL